MLGLTYTVGMLSITVGYHRYFSHKTFRTNRAVQFVMGFLGCCQLQGGPIAWSAVHRHHHRHSDLEADLHSPVHGFYNAHVGWLLNPRTYQVAFKPLQDLSSYREIVWLDRYNFIPAVLALCLLYLVGELNAHRDPASTVDGLFCSIGADLENRFGLARHLVGELDLSLLGKPAVRCARPKQK